MSDGNATVHLLRPVRVLVAGQDRCLVEGLGHDLSLLGFDAMATTRPERVATLAAIERVDVVIIDTSGGLAAAASLAGALDELPHRVCVLLVGPPGGPAERLGYDVIDNDESHEELAAAVHRAYRTGPNRASRASRR